MVPLVSLANGLLNWSIFTEVMALFSAEDKCKLDIASQCSVYPDGTWLKHDIRSTMVDTNIPLWGGGLSFYGRNLY